MKKRIINFNEFVERARLIHGDKYRYVESSYSSIENKVDIICSKYGKFSQKASNHISLKQGCPICGKCESKPNYYYIVNGRRVYRFNLRKSVLESKYGCKHEMTEREFCLKNKWYRIYDCGCMCYEYTNNRIDSL